MLCLAGDRLRPEGLSAVYFVGEFAGVLSVGMGHLLGAVSVIGLLLLSALLPGWFLDLIVNPAGASAPSTSPSADEPP